MNSVSLKCQVEILWVLTPRGVVVGYQGFRSPQPTIPRLELHRRENLKSHIQP